MRDHAFHPFRHTRPGSQHGGLRPGYRADRGRGRSRRFAATGPDPGGRACGRTGRAGKSGRAFTIAASEDDRKYVAAIEKLIGKSIPLVDGEAAAAPSETADSKPARSKAPKSKAAKANANGNDPAKAETKPRAPAESNRGRGRGRSRKAEAHPGELPPPPDCKGDTLHDTGHVPAFLLR